jgi:Platelet-activating factor acetylhydrolase, isoform II
LHLTDASRPDPWVAEAAARELMVSVWYPATPADGPRAPYMTAAESELLLSNAGVTGVPPRVATALAREAPRRDRSEKVVAGRAADVSFVLDELTGAHPPWPGAGLIDASRIGMAGHSIGGAAAIAAVLADPRILAGINMDGATSAPIPGGGLSRPFLFLGKQSNFNPGVAITSERQRKMAGSVATWERDWKLMTGWKLWLTVAGAVHASFTDLGLVAEQIGVDTEAEIHGTRSLEITRAYVRAFFDQHLRGDPQTLLEQPSPHYPEVTFCSPKA